MLGKCLTLVACAAILAVANAASSPLKIEISISEDTGMADSPETANSSVLEVCQRSIFTTKPDCPSPWYAVQMANTWKCCKVLGTQSTSSEEVLSTTHRMRVEEPVQAAKTICSKRYVPKGDSCREGWYWIHEQCCKDFDG
ncbi:hypothetical protein LZ554_005757 [Drepanopeziza brunnea f. sp. 'monogermtubi']|nr:hypothetical protein LZ554_005757 [Drepanopeziza brunnea f. sp. 'monogermtubi']